MGNNLREAIELITSLSRGVLSKIACLAMTHHQHVVNTKALSLGFCYRAVLREAWGGRLKVQFVWASRNLGVVQHPQAVIKAVASI